MRNGLTNSLAVTFLTGMLLLITGCTGFFDDVASTVDDIIGRRTPREAFAHDFFRDHPHRDSLTAAWDTAYVRALRDTLRVDLPHRETIRRPDGLPHTALSVRFTLPPGRLLTVTVDRQSTEPVFGELLRVAAAGSVSDRDAVQRWEAGEAALTFEAESPDGEELMLVLQSPTADSGAYTLTLRSDPALLFPVAGRSARDIKSFWGDSRSGGARRHQGNDIFAPRGTPLLAVADGMVRSTKIGGLGGKTVWLRDGEGRGLNYYYAHLDSQLVRPGQIVARGDTVGLVGNTGNARTTPPHLHFGIYRRGARDPYPYLLGPDGEPDPARYVLGADGLPAAVPARGRHYLRHRPESRPAAVVRELENAEPVTVLSVTDRYYRIRTGRGETGFVNFD